jgi:putative MFS transporter
VYRRRTAVVWTLWATAYFITNGLNNWMPTLYSSVYQLNLQQALRAGTMTNVAQVIVLLGCAFLIDRIGRRTWTVVSFAAGAALLMGLGLFNAQSVVAVIVFVTLSYGILGSVNAVLYLYTPEIYPTRMRASGPGAATCGLRLASAAGPLRVGHLVATGRAPDFALGASSGKEGRPQTATGVEMVFFMFAAAGMIGAVAATRMLETRNRRLEEIAP